MALAVEMTAAEKQARAQALTDIGAATAMELGTAWKFIGAGVEDSRIDPPYARVIGPEGREITVHRIWDKQDRIVVNGVFPKVAGMYHMPYGATRPEITLAITRGPNTIAKEIKRRFMPLYEALFAQIKERADATNAYDAQVAQNMTRLLKIAGTKPPYEQQKRQSGEQALNINVPKGYADARVGGDYVRFDRLSIPLDVAEQVIRTVTALAPLPTDKQLLMISRAQADQIAEVIRWLAGSPAERVGVPPSIADALAVLGVKEGVN